jgi:hypothetical protein
MVVHTDAQHKRLCATLLCAVAQPDRGVLSKGYFKTPLGTNRG